MLSALAPHLPHAVRSRALWLALNEVRSIGDAGFRARELAPLVSHIADFLYHETLTGLREVSDEALRVRIIVELTPHLPEPHRGVVLHEVLAALSSVADETTLAEAITTLAPYVPDPLIPVALDMVRIVADPEIRARALVAYVLRLNESGRGGVLPQEIMRARAVTDPTQRAAALAVLAPCLSKGQLQEARDALRAVTEKRGGPRFWQQSHPSRMNHAGPPPSRKLSRRRGWLQIMPRGPGP